MSHEENNLTPPELERLSLVMEEMAEVIQIIGKIQRHGYEEYHPDTPDITNRMLLEKELGHVQDRVSLLISNKDVSEIEIEIARHKKQINGNKYLHFGHKAYTLGSTF